MNSCSTFCTFLRFPTELILFFFFQLSFLFFFEEIKEIEVRVKEEKRMMKEVKKKKYIKEKVPKGSDGIIVKFFFFYNKPTPYLDHKSYENFCMFYENLQFCDSVSLRILTTDRSDQSYYFVIFICNIIFIHYKVKVLTIKFIVYTICFYCSIVIQ